MQTSPAFESAPAAHSGAGKVPQRRVIDAPTRMFHWLFASSFLGAYLTADSERWRALHVGLGYTLAGLLAFRVLYGVLGPRHARLGPMLRKMGGAPAWLRSAAQGLQKGTLVGINWRQGQNLLMTLAVLTLLVLVIPLTLSGYGTYNDWGDLLGGDWLEDVHEFFSNAFLVVVLGHIALIFALSLLRRKNQAAPMLSGSIDGAGPDLVKNNHAWLAALLLACVLSFIGWHLQQSPQGLMPTQWLPQEGTDHHSEDDG